jgi:hypothetical protein
MKGSDMRNLLITILIVLAVIALWVYLFGVPALRAH